MTHTTHSLEDLFPCISCGVNADPADGFGNCTCGNEKLRERIDHYTTTKINEVLDAVEEAIGEDDELFTKTGDSQREVNKFWQGTGRNFMRAELRQKLSQIRKEQS